MRILPSISNYNYNSVVKRACKSQNQTQVQDNIFCTKTNQPSFKSFKFEQSDSEVKDIYKNGREIYDTLKKIMPDIDKEYNGLFKIDAFVDKRREPRRIIFYVMGDRSNRDLFYKYVLDNEKKTGLHPNIVRACECMYSCIHEDEKDMEYNQSLTRFPFDGASLDPIDYPSNNDANAKRKFIEKVQETFQPANLMAQLVQKAIHPPIINPSIYDKMRW